MGCEIHDYDGSSWKYESTSTASTIRSLNQNSLGMTLNHTPQSTTEVTLTGIVTATGGGSG